jgi:hypothetical protein
LPRRPSRVAFATTLVAALGSGTLVVTSGGRVHVRSLADGAELWSGAVRPGASDVHSPVLVERALYVVADGVLVRMDPEEKPAADWPRP